MSGLSREFFERMPKVELHIHLEGAVPRAGLDELAAKYGRPPLAALLDRPARPGSRPSFADFVDVWTRIGELLREYEDYRFIAGQVAADLGRQNIRYAEVLFSPARDAAAHLEPDRIAAAVAAGFEAAAVEGGPAALLIADFVRDNGPAQADRALEALLAMPEKKIVGIGLGGSEAPFPPAPFAPVFGRARDAGLHTQAHAGESAGPESVWGAIRDLRVERIAHGVRVREDAALLAHFAGTGLPLDLCPTSNVRTGAVEKLSDHPAADFLRRGLKVHLCTDDPTLFGTDLAGEFETVVRAFGLGRNDVRALLDNAVEAAWCGPGEKFLLSREIEAFFKRG
jgi:adenosine deaminase